MALGERGAARRHDVFHPFLPHPDQVHVSLNHQDLPFPADRRERLVESVQDGTLMAPLRFRGVEVLGDCIVDRAGTEAADSPPRVRDGKDHPSPEPLPVPAALAGDKKSGPPPPPAGALPPPARAGPPRSPPPPPPYPRKNSCSASGVIPLRRRNSRAPTPAGDERSNSRYVSEAAWRIRYRS